MGGTEKDNVTTFEVRVIHFERIEKTTRLDDGERRDRSRGEKGCLPSRKARRAHASERQVDRCRSAWSRVMEKGRRRVPIKIGISNGARTFWPA